MPRSRSHRRIARLKGRTDDMFIVKGVNIFPIQVEQVLLRLLGWAPTTASTWSGRETGTT